MPARRDPGTKAETNLAHARMSRGVTQAELAEAIGISLPTYRRLERGETDNPPLGYLVNCALALGVKFDDLVEDRWRRWWTFDERRSSPPDPEQFWRPPHRTGDADDLAL